MFIMPHGGRCLLAGGSDSERGTVIKQIEESVARHHCKALIESARQRASFRQAFWETDVAEGEEEGEKAGLGRTILREETEPPKRHAVFRAFPPPD